MRAKEITTPPTIGTAPPHRPVPAPRAIIGSLNSRAIFTVALTARASAGMTTAEGSRPSVYASKE